MNNITNDIVSKAAIKTLLDERIKAIYDKDMSGVIAHYSPNYKSFDLKEPLKNKGLESVKIRLKEWFDSYKSAIHQELNCLEINATDDLAFAYCLTRTFGTNMKGEKNDMWYRTTTCFRKIDDKWMIVHQHDSEPIDMETGMAIFNLQP